MKTHFILLKIKRGKIFKIEAENTGRGNSMREDDFRGLVAKLYLCIGSKVLLTTNQVNIGLSNSSTGIVKNITCNNDRPAPKLPKFAWVDFGTAYRSFFFPDDINRNS